MIGNLFPSLDTFSTPVQVLDSESFGIVFSSASPMRVSVLDDKRVTKFQVESGGERSDHIIENAVEVAIEFILSGSMAKTQYESMRAAYDENRLVLIQTRMRTYEDMVIEAFPHEETPTVYEGAVLFLRFSEWRGVQPEYGELQQNQVANPANSSTVEAGAATGSDAPPATQEKSSIWYRRFGGGD